MKNKKNKPVCTTSVGGQAVLEGVMMMGKTSYCTAVRDTEGEIQVERIRLKPRSVASRIPIVRGMVNMVTSLVRGMKALMRSSEVYAADDEEPGRIEKWFAEKLNVDIFSILSIFATIIGVALAVGLFVWLPNFLVSDLLIGWFPVLSGSIWEYVILGVVRVLIFLIYLTVILLLKDIRRLYRYHGAEHKTINCYEKGWELTSENVMKCSRIHDRCGTSFIFIVLIINIVVIGVVNWLLKVHEISPEYLKILAKIGIEIVLLPVITGISYEILKLLAHFHGPVSKIFKAPGMLLQKVLTTREPDAEMVEVAIAAFNAAMEMDKDPALGESKFVTGGMLKNLIAETKKQFTEKEIDESDAEWIYSIVLEINRSDLNKVIKVKPSQMRVISDMVEKRLTGRPLWYIIGDVDFYDCKIKVDERVLIPRPETEMMAEQTVRLIEEGDKVLDMCTGSGCLAISIAKHCKDKNIKVTAVDVSDAALMVAKENANLNSVDINFVQSDLFEHVHGRFNIIVCNPPYIKTSEIPYLQKEVKNFEPRIALDGGDDGLEFYKRLAKEVSRYVVRGGMLVLEVGEGQAEAVLKLFEKRDYAMVGKDLSGVDRFLKIAF